MYSEKILQYINDNHLLMNGDHVLVAVSAGPDSMCLLHYLIKLKETPQFCNMKISVAHVNHHTRGTENEEEQALIKAYCQQNELNFYKRDFYYESNQNFHQEARNFRYQFFLDTSIKIGVNKVVLGHHRDDQVETILFRILRGSNLNGYTGIPNNYNLSDQVTVIRPFLELNKDEILHYCRMFKIPFKVDSSNESNDYTRNVIRNDIIPKLATIQSDVKDKILQLKEQIEEAQPVLDELYIQSYNKSLIEMKEKEIDFNRSQLKTIKPAILRMILAHALNILSQGLFQASYTNQNTVINLINSDKPNITYNLGQGYYVKIEYDLFRITTVLNNEKPYEIEINEYKEYNLPNSIKLNVKKEQEKAKINNNKLNLCYNKSMWPLKVRTRRNGDKIRTKIGHKKISRIFINHKIPKSKRDSWPILTDANDRILWVIGLEKSNIEKDIDCSFYIKVEVK